MKAIFSNLFFASTLFGSALAATPGCGKAPSTIKAGTNTVTVNGKTREWILTLPDKYDNTKPYKLIFGIHWLGGQATDVANGGIIKPYYGLPALANNTAIFVSPNGLKSGGSGGWPNTGGEDMNLIREILKATDANLCIDETHRYSLGFSYGGAMSYAIACALPTEFRAIAVLSGGPMSGCVGGTGAVAFYGQHGLSDQVLPIASTGRALRDRFVANNGCTKINPVEPTRGSKSHVLTKYTGCKEGKNVWWTAFDGDHTPIPADTGASKETTYTAARVWEFFQEVK